MTRKIGLVLFALWLWAGQALAAGLSVVVNAEATVAGSQLRLGDMAEVAGDDADKVRALQELRLGSAPSPGSRLVLTADMLAARLAGTGADFSGVTWQIPPTVTIYASGQSVSGETLQAMAADAIKQRLGVSSGNDSADVTVDPTGEARDVMVPPGQISYKAELPYGLKLNVPTTVSVAISADGRLFTTVSLKFNVKVYRNVVVASRNITAFEVVGPESLRMERWDISRLSGYATDAGKIAGLRTRRTLAAGTPISEAAMEKPPLVKHGSVVTILAKAGDIVVSAKGQALQEGCEGAVIRVQNLNSNKIVSARVIDGATVQVITSSRR